ncbi:phosphoglucomutase/phosphomannomutase, partial [mine drainage metagenome]
SKSHLQAGWESIGTITADNTAVDRYLRGVISRVDTASIARKNYRIAADPACGAAYYSTPAMLGMLGCRITAINAFPDGLFTARNPEPRPENLSVLLSTMKDGNHDLGVAHDGDADRATFVDENGDFVEGDRILSLIVKHHARKGDVIVTPVSTSDSIDDV